MTEGVGNAFRGGSVPSRLSLAEASPTEVERKDF